VSNVWEELHSNYQGKDWLEKPSMFAEQVSQYFPSHGVILDLGAGQGQDSTYFADKGYEVISSDREISIIEQANERAKTYFANKNEPMKAMRFQLIDLSKLIPLSDSRISVVYAHLSLHYFDASITEQIFSEIYRILKPGGTLAFLVNSKSDPEYGTGKELEKDLFLVEGKTKRYFSVESAKAFAYQLETVLCDEEGKTYKDIDKGVHNLIRYVGKKA